VRPRRCDPGIGARLAHAIDEIRDLAARPQPRHEVVPGIGLGQIESERERARAAEVVAGQPEAHRTGLQIPTEQDELIALEEIGQRARHQVPHDPRRHRAIVVQRFELQIGEHRPVEAREDLADRHFHVLARQHVGALGPTRLGDAVEERDVDVGPHAEGENPPLVHVRRLHHLANAHLRRLSDRRQAVGQEEDDGQRLRVVRLTKSLEQRVVEVRPPHGAQARQILARLGDRRRILGDRTRREHLHLIGVIDDVERLSVVESLEHLQRGRSRLFELLAAHAARAVEDEDHFAADVVDGVPEVRGQSCHQEEVAAAVHRIRACHHRGRNAVALPQIGQPERPRSGRS